MWKAVYQCVVVDRGCDPVERYEVRHPVLDQSFPPHCTDHSQPMRLASYRPYPSEGKPAKRVRRRRGGFQAHQEDLPF